MDAALRARPRTSRIREIGWAFCLLCSVCAAQVSAQVTDVAIKAELVERFILFTRFPDESLAQRRFVVCVVGEDALARAIDKRLEDARLHERKATVERGDIDFAATNCNVVIVTEFGDEGIDGVLAGFDGKPVLSIASAAELSGSGVMINVLIENRRAVFEVDQSAVDEAGLELSSMLLRYARFVDNEE